MMMTAPFMAVAMNGDSAIRINTERILVHGDKILPTTPMHPNDLKALPSTMAFRLKSKSIPMSKGL